MNKEIEKLQEIIDDSENIVFFGGAGVSTESNIPDFRSADGLYQQKYKYSPEQIVSHTFFMRNTEGFYEFYLLSPGCVLHSGIGKWRCVHCLPEADGLPFLLQEA